MKLSSRQLTTVASISMLLYTSFSVASDSVGPAATVALNFGSLQTKPRIGLGLGLYSVASPTEARMAPLLLLSLGGQNVYQRGTFPSSIISSASPNSSAQTPEESHTLLYVAGAVAIVAVGTLLLTARHNAPPTQGSGGSNPPVQ